MEKKKIREEIKKLCSQNAALLAQKSAVLCNKIIESKEYNTADEIFAYMALADEVDLSSVISDALENNKKVALPKIIDFENGIMQFFYLDEAEAISTQTESGTLGIKEPDEKKAAPVDLAKLDNKKILILVPGRAFTKDGDRLGRGKGFYDRYLNRLLRCARNDTEVSARNDIILAGVCFDFQIKKSLPVSRDDVKMDVIF